jgi:hypothetical protein
MGESRRGPVFKAGGDQYNAYAEQGDATLNAAVSNNSGPANAAVLSELQALREMLSQLGSPASSATALLEAAEKEAKAPEPRRDEVAGYVETAMKLAAGVNGFAEQADKLIPRLQQIAAWSGRAWDLGRLALGL